MAALAARPSPSDSAMKIKRDEIQQTIAASNTALQTVVRVALICHAPGPKLERHSEMPSYGRFTDTDVQKGAFPTSSSLHDGHRTFSATSDDEKPGFYVIGVESLEKSDPAAPSVTRSTLVTLNIKGDFTTRPVDLLREVKQALFRLLGIAVEHQPTSPVPLDQLQFLAGPLSTTPTVVDGIDGRHLYQDWVAFIDQNAAPEADRPAKVKEVHVLATLSAATLLDMSKARSKGTIGVSTDADGQYQVEIPTDSQFDVLNALVGTAPLKRTAKLTWMDAAQQETYGKSDQAPRHWPTPADLEVATAVKAVAKRHEAVLANLASNITKPSTPTPVRGSIGGGSDNPIEILSASPHSGRTSLVIQQAPTHMSQAERKKWYDQIAKDAKKRYSQRLLSLDPDAEEDRDDSEIGLMMFADEDDCSAFLGALKDAFELHKDRHEPMEWSDRYYDGLLTHVFENTMSKEPHAYAEEQHHIKVAPAYYLPKVLKELDKQRVEGQELSDRVRVSNREKHRESSLGKSVAKRLDFSTVDRPTTSRSVHDGVLHAYLGQQMDT